MRARSNEQWLVGKIDADFSSHANFNGEEILLTECEILISNEYLQDSEVNQEPEVYQEPDVDQEPEVYREPEQDAEPEPEGDSEPEVGQWHDGDQGSEMDLIPEGDETL